MTYLGMLCLGGFVGGLLILGLGFIRGWTTFRKAITFVLAAAFSGVVFQFIQFLSGQGLQNAVSAYPVGLLLALLWYYAKAATNNIRSESRGVRILGWGYLLVLLTANVVALAVILPPTINEAWESPVVDRDEVVGYWIQDHHRDDDKDICSLVQISYDPRTENFVMEGFGFQVDERDDEISVDEHSAWRTTDVDQSETDDRIHISFDYKASLYPIAREDPDNAGRPNPLIGRGEADFRKRNNVFTSGTGYYINEKSQRTDVTYQKLSQSEYPELKDYVHLPQQGKRIVTKYWQRKRTQQ